MPIQPLRGEPEPAPLGFSLERIVRHLGGPSVDGIRALFEEWESIVGQPMAAHTWPIALTDRCLQVGVDDPAWASHLRFLERELCGQVNDRLGPEAADSVSFRVRPGGPDGGLPDDGRDDPRDRVGTDPAGPLEPS